jgi:hypothetical protein
LSQLPWIGYLFRETVDSTTKQELIVILTPHVWRVSCPEGLNYLGPPRTLGLDKRVAQRPAEERRDGASVYELVRPEPPQPGPVVKNPLPLDARREVPAGAKQPVGSSEFR